MTFGYAQLDVKAFYDYAAKKENLGKLVFSVPLDSTNAQKYYLQILPPEYETYQVTINDDLIKKKSINLNRSYLTVPVGNAYSQFYLWAKEKRCMSTHAYETGKILCVVEIPPRYYKFEIDTVIINEDTTYSVIEKVVDAKRMVKPSEVKIYKSKEEVNPDLPSYEILGGEWSKWEMYYCHGGCGKPFPVKKLQTRLIEQGYDLELTEIIDMKTKSALVDFQKKNGLPEGRLDNDTLRMLKVIPEPKY